MKQNGRLEDQLISTKYSENMVLSDGSVLIYQYDKHVSLIVVIR